MKVESGGIDAVSFARWSWAVIEDVSKMSVAFFTSYFRSYHAMAGVFKQFYILSIFWIGKAGPATSGLELGVGSEEFGTAADTHVGALFFVLVVFAGERCFGGSFASDVILLGGELVFVRVVVLVVDFGHGEGLASKGVVREFLNVPVGQFGSSLVGAFEELHDGGLWVFFLEDVLVTQNSHGRTVFLGP